MDIHIGEYIKNNKGIKVGYLLGFKRFGEVLIGWSLYNKNKEKVPFDKYVAKAIAFVRASTFEDLKWPSSLHSKILKFNERCHKYFKV